MSGLPDPRLPTGPLATAWRRSRDGLPLVSPLRKRQLRIVVVGSGLAGSAAAASLAEQGYQVQLVTFHDSPRRAHSVAAQGGINAAKNYANDGDSVERLFADTLKGGDFRAREAGCYRLAEISGAIIDQCVAQGVPFAREYGGTLANRNFGGSLVSRTFYARGQTGQQLLYGAYQSLMRQVAAGRVELLTRREMLELVTQAGVARGVVCRNLLSGELETYTANAVVLASGGYTNVYYLSTNALKSNASAIWRAHLEGALFANPCFTQIHPTCIPSGDVYQSKLTLMSESLRNDGRVWLPLKAGDRRPPDQIPEAERDYFSSANTPATATWCLGMWPPGGPGSSAMGAMGWGRAAARSTSISMTPLPTRAPKSLKSATAICLRCISGSPGMIQWPHRCGSIPPRTTQWGVCGWTTT